MALTVTYNSFLPPHLRKRQPESTKYEETLGKEQQTAHSRATSEDLPPHLRRRQIHLTPSSTGLDASIHAQPQNDSAPFSADNVPPLLRHIIGSSSTSTNHVATSVGHSEKCDKEASDSTNIAAIDLTNPWDFALPEPAGQPLSMAELPDVHQPQTTEVVNDSLLHSPPQQNAVSRQNEGLGGDLVTALRLSLERGNDVVAERQPPPSQLTSNPLDKFSVETQGSLVPADTTVQASLNHALCENTTMRARPKGKKSAWIKNKDIKARAPSPDSNAWGSVNGGEGGGEGEGGDDVDSVRADNSWSTQAKRINHDQGYQLQDWDGNWAPAPVDWEERGCFKDQAWGQHIDQWLGDSAVIPHDKIDMTAEGFLGQDAGDLAPKSWVPEHIDLVPMYDWWVRHLKSPLYDGPQDAKPWWVTYRFDESQILSPLVVPSTRGTDPSKESDKERSKRNQDRGSDRFSQKYLDKIAEKQLDRQFMRARAAQDRAADRKREEERAKNPKPFYLRHVRTCDISSVKDIYNRHIQHTVHTMETNSLTNEDVRAMVNVIQGARLPFIVAVQQSKGTGPKSQRDLTKNPRGKILGFACAKDYSSGNSMFRNTFVLEIYVDPGHYRKNVGEALMDRLTVLLAGIFYFPRTDYDFFEGGGPDHESQRICKNIVVQMSYAADDEKRLEWMSKWLAKWEFSQVGIYKEIGVKLRKRVSLALFQKTTPEEINLAW